MSERILTTGNEAAAEAAIRAGLHFYAGYPITPQNELTAYMAAEMPKNERIFIQSESELSAINMVFGASATGARAMTSSSSPGISLKQEGISYAAGADLPIFIGNVMRGGPGLGNIAGAQGDYWQATRGGGHGDYRTFVMAPNSVNEMANFPHKCFEVSFKYRIPSMVLADGIIGQMMEPVEFKYPEVDVKTLKEPEWALGKCEGRNKRIVKSYDLKEGGVEIMVNERVKRYKQIEQNEVIYEEKQIEDADIVMVAYGTSARVSVAAMKLAREKGLKVGLLRPITLWPFPKARLIELSKRVKNFLVVEMSLGQMVEDVALAINGRTNVHLHAKPGASIITAEEVVKTLESISKKEAKEYAAVK